MLTQHLSRVASAASCLALAIQLVALIVADPGIAASGGGDFPYRRW